MEAVNKRVAELVDAVVEGYMPIEQAEETGKNEDWMRIVPGASIGLIQDGVAQVGQGKIALRADDHLGRSDAGIILYRKLWQEELRALDEGQPLREFYRPEWFYGTP